MEKIKMALAKLFQEIKGPKGSRYILLGGFLTIIFSCVLFLIGGGFSMAAENPASSAISTIILLIAMGVFIVGVITTTIGGIMVIIRRSQERNRKIPQIPENYIQCNEHSITPLKKEDLPSSNQSRAEYGLSIEQRKLILQREINKYLRQGYRVISQTDTTAQLIKPKKFSCLLFLIFAFLLIGWIFYLLWYWSKRDRQIYIEIDFYGNVRIRK